MISVALIILTLWAIIALLGPILPIEPERMDLIHILDLPSWDSWLGWDDLGRPVLDRLISGAHTSFLVSFGVVSISLIFGTLFGMLAAYFGRWWDLAAIRIIDIFLAFPGILLAIALAGLLGPG